MIRTRRLSERLMVRYSWCYTGADGLGRGVPNDTEPVFDNLAWAKEVLT